jgi:hypothetical protein
VAVEGVVWGLPNARKGLTLTQLRKVPGFLAYSKLTTDGKEVSIMFCRRLNGWAGCQIARSMPAGVHKVAEHMLTRPQLQAAHHRVSCNC